GMDPRQLDAIAARLQSATGRTSAPGSGMFNLAFAAIDMACWDLKAKFAEQSLCAFLGSARDRIPAYASGALLRGFSMDVYQRTAQTLVERGFRQVKMQLGTESSAAEALARARALREAVGPEIDLMCDVNQLWSVHQAIDMGHRLAPYNLYWIEDPTIP